MIHEIGRVYNFSFSAFHNLSNFHAAVPRGLCDTSGPLTEDHLYVKLSNKFRQMSQISHKTSQPLFCTSAKTAKDSVKLRIEMDKNLKKVEKKEGDI